MINYIVHFAVIFFLFISVKKIISRFSLTFLQSIGFEYIVLGFLLNSNLLDSTIYLNLDLFIPALYLCITLTGLRLGMDLRFTDFGKISTISFKVAFFDIFISFLILFSILLSGIIFLLNVTTISYDLLIFITAMSVIGVSSSKTISKAVSSEKKISKKLSTVVTNSIEFHQTLTVLIFGFIFTTLPFLSSVAIYEFESVSSIWISFFVAILFGFILQLIIANLDDFEAGSSLFLFMAAIISTSIAFYFNLSPILIALVCGIVLNNVSEQRNIIKASLEKTAHVSTSLIVMYACMTVRFSHPIISVFLLMIYIVIRYLAKIAGQKIAYSFIKSDQLFTDKFSAIFMSQGRLALVLLVTFQLIYQSEWLDVIQLTIIFAVLINQYIGYNAFRNFIIDNDLKFKESSAL